MGFYIAKLSKNFKEDHLRKVIDFWQANFFHIPLQKRFQDISNEVSLNPSTLLNFEGLKFENQIYVKKLIFLVRGNSTNHYCMQNIRCDSSEMKFFFEEISYSQRENLME